MELSDFSRVLTHLRKEKGVSQKQAAKELGVSQSLLSHYERGIRECGLIFLVRAAEYYGVTADYLLGRSYDKHGMTISLEELSDEDAGGTGNSGIKSMLPVLNKKLICNSVSVIMDILAKSGNKKLINEVSGYLGISVYKMFRMLYNSNSDNSPILFGADEKSYSYMSDAAMSRCQADIQKQLTEICQNCDDISFLKMDEEYLKTVYPVLSASLFNLLQNAENKIGARKK